MIDTSQPDVATSKNMEAVNLFVRTTAHSDNFHWVPCDMNGLRGFAGVLVSNDDIQFAMSESGEFTQLFSNMVPVCFVLRAEDLQWVDVHTITIPEGGREGP